MLKLVAVSQGKWITAPAAFGRLCVETMSYELIPELQAQPPSGGCVLKPQSACQLSLSATSRLRAAVC